MDVAEIDAMGCRCRVVVDGGPPDAAGRAVCSILALERRWSRFLPGSEVSRLNASPGFLTLVSPLTYRLVEIAEAARVRTGGVFNPLMLGHIESLGYARPWRHGPTATRPAPDPPSVDPIELFPELMAVRLPESARFDPGGIGKGLAADIVAEELVDLGVSSASVELGGDLRVIGRPWYGHRWRIGICHPERNDVEIASVTLEGGAVGTSSRLRRRWRSRTGDQHHLLDSATGRSAQTDVVTASAWGASAAWSEVAAKVALISGSHAAPDVFERLRVSGLVVTGDGQVISSDGSRTVVVGDRVEKPDPEVVR